MNVENYRGWFIVGILASILLAATPTLALFVRTPDVSEKFSELWLLGPNHKAEDYPLNVGANEIYTVYVSVGNRLGYSAYYRVLVKFCNQTLSLPLSSNSTPSPLPALYEFNIFIRDDGISENLFHFELLDIDRSDEILAVNKMSINGATLAVNRTTIWDVEGNGFYFQFFFELWLYNASVLRFQYHNRFVGFWLNITA